MTKPHPPTRWTLLIAVACVLVGTLLGPGLVEAAKNAVTRVFVTNDAARPLLVKATGQTQVGGAVTVTGGKLDVSGSKVDTSGSTVAVSGGKIDTSGSTVAVSGGKLDVSGSSVSIAPTTPFQASGFIQLTAGSSANFKSISIPTGKSLVVQYVTVFVYGDSSANLPLDISVQDGNGTGGAAIYMPLHQAGTEWEGSETTQALFSHAPLLNAFRPSGTAGNAYVEFLVSGYLV